MLKEVGEVGFCYFIISLVRKQNSQSSDQNQILIVHVDSSVNYLRQVALFNECQKLKYFLRRFF